MTNMLELQASYEPAQGVSRIFILGWRGGVDVVARCDGKEAITVKGDRRCLHEEWRLHKMDDGRLIWTAHLTRGPARLLHSEESRQRMTVLIPPSMAGQVEVVRYARQR